MGEVIETLDEFSGQKPFVLLEPVALRSESSGLNILDFEFDGFRGNRRDVNVKVIAHKIIITVPTSTINCYY